MKVLGQKKVVFPDGTVITHSPTQDIFKNTIFGTLRHVINGSMTFTDETNDIEAFVNFGAARGKPDDYFLSEIR